MLGMWFGAHSTQAVYRAARHMPAVSGCLQALTKKTTQKTWKIAMDQPDALDAQFADMQRELLARLAHPPAAPRSATYRLPDQPADLLAASTRIRGGASRVAFVRREQLGWAVFTMRCDQRMPYIVVCARLDVVWEDEAQAHSAALAWERNANPGDPEGQTELGIA